MPEQEKLTIGRLAKAAGLNVETIRYYQRRGLLEEPQKPLGGHRRYSSRDIFRLGFIRRAQQLGFSLDEVKALLEISDGRSCGEARAVAERRFAVIESRIAELTAMRRQLRSLITACADNRSRSSCPLIDSLSRPDGPA